MNGIEPNYERPEERYYYKNDSDEMVKIVRAGSDKVVFKIVRCGSWLNREIGREECLGSEIFRRFYKYKVPYLKAKLLDETEN